MKKKRNPKKRIGTSLLLFSALLLIALLPSAAAKKKPSLDTYGVVSGTVFDGSGYALPDANVTLAPESESGDKTKPMETVSSARGEFVFHVPPGPMRYSVAVAAKGYQSQQKSVSVQDQERVEVTFQLDRESK
jgi:Carboxypeptidase regulatory-like domain